MSPGTIAGFSLTAKTPGLACVAGAPALRRVPNLTSIPSGACMRHVYFRYGLPLSSLSKEVQEFAGRHSVENIAGTQPALTGDAYTKTHFVQPGNSMCIWINGNLDTFVPGAMQVTPIQIQARGVCVDLDADAVRGGGIDHCLQVQSIAISFKQDAPGGMPNDINVRVGDGPEHTLCLLLRRGFGMGLNCGNAAIQGFQNFVWQIGAAVAPDIRLLSPPVPLRTRSFRVHA